MYNFIYSSSDEYAPYCLTSMHSLLRNNKDLCDVKFYVLSNNINNQTKDLMRRICDQYSAKLTFIDCKSTIYGIFASGGKLNFNPSSFLRIFIPELLPNCVEKALFIDSDTYVNTGISKLYNTNISGYLCAMSYNQPIYRGMLREASLEDGEGYFNAGVILLNLAAWRENNIQERILEYYYAHGGNFPTDDQSVINAIVGRQTLVLDYKYNAMTEIFYWSYKKFCDMNTYIGRKTKEEYLDAKHRPVIIHFNGPGIRPWQKWCGHPYTHVFRRELKQCFPEITFYRQKRSVGYLLAQYLKHTIFEKIICIIHDGIYIRR